MKNNTSANFKLRLLAWLTDYCLILLIFMMWYFFITSQPTLPMAISQIFLFMILIFLNPIVVLHSVLLVHFFGGTLGKLLCGLRVTDENGGRLPFKRIFFRQSIGYSFSSLIFGLGFWSIAKNPMKQGWHDKAVGSKVIVKQNLWPLAIATCVITTFASAYFGVNSYYTATTGPLAVETNALWKQIDAGIKEDKAKSKTVYKAPAINPKKVSSPTVISSIRKTGACEWAITFNLYGFPPNSQININSEGTKYSCAHPKTPINYAWSENQKSTTLSDGTATIVYGHVDFGTYNYSFTDIKNHRVINTLTYPQN